MQKESRAQDKQMAAVGYISNREELVIAAWSLFQHDGAAALKLSERSLLPPAFSAKNLPGGGTQISHVHLIRRINHHPVEGDKDSTPASISDTEDLPNWNSDLDNPNDSEDDCAGDDKSDIEHNNGIEDPEYPVQQQVSAVLNVPRLVQPTGKSKRQVEKGLVMIKAVETRRNKGVKKN